MKISVRFCRIYSTILEKGVDFYETKKWSEKWLKTLVPGGICRSGTTIIHARQRKKINVGKKFKNSFQTSGFCWDPQVGGLGLAWEKLGHCGKEAVTSVTKEDVCANRMFLVPLECCESPQETSSRWVKYLKLCIFPKQMWIYNITALSALSLPSSTAVKSKISKKMYRRGWNRFAPTIKFIKIENPGSPRQASIPCRWSWARRKTASRPGILREQKHRFKFSEQSSQFRHRWCTKFEPMRFDLETPR